jgi:hypothetical protein
MGSWLQELRGMERYLNILIILTFKSERKNSNKNEQLRINKEKNKTMEGVKYST